MLRCEALAKLVCPIGMISTVHLTLMIVLLSALNGCIENGGSQATPDLSMPVNATVGPTVERPPSSTDVHQALQAYPVPFPATDETTDPSSDLMYADGPPPRSDSPDDLATTTTSTPTGVTVRLYWPHSEDANIFGYYVYYGKQPAQESGSCSSYEANQSVDAPPATIIGLDHDTLYFFAVKKFNESENSCSEEILLTTPPAETEQAERAMEPRGHHSGLPVKG